MPTKEVASVMDTPRRHNRVSVGPVFIAGFLLVTVPAIALCDDDVFPNRNPTPLVFGGGGMQTDETQKNGGSSRDTPSKEDAEKKADASGNKPSGDSNPPNGGIFGALSNYLRGGQ